MWITEIRLKNYRAFGEEVVVSIPGKRHLLIYGENGSGKSSLCNAVREVLKNPLADDVDDSYTVNIWYDKKQGEETGEIKLVFDDDMQVTWKQSGEFEYDGKTTNNEENEDDKTERIRSSALRLGKLSGFLSYKDLIPIYGPTLLSPEAEGERMFSLFTKVLFAHYEMKDVGSEGANRTREFSEIYRRIQQRLLDGDPYEDIDLRGILEESISDVKREDVDEGEELSEEEKKEPIYKGQKDLDEILDQEMAETDRKDIFTNWDVRGELEALQREVNEARAKIVVEANRYLTTYFKSKVVFNVSDINIRVELTEDGEDIKFIDPFVAFGVGLYQTQIPDYRDTLNEARLSSFSLCFMLAAIKQLPVAPGDPRVLFLDDIFTGLDLSNRMPLLELIKTEFMDDPIDKAPFQVAIATHDRGWYELAERWFKAEKIPAKTIEMYAQRVPGDDQPDRPVILDRSSSYLEQAEAYLRAGDYAAAALNMRKACEEKFVRLLPPNRLWKVNEDDKLVRKGNLHALLEHLDIYCDKLGVETTLFSRLRRLKGRILNPFAHNDQRAPFYRSEIEEALLAVKELDEVDVEVLIKAEDGVSNFLTWSHNNRDYSIIPLEEVRLLRFQDQPAILSPFQCQNEHGKCDDLKEMIRMMYGRIMRRGNIREREVECFGEIKFMDGRTLAEVLEP